MKKLISYLIFILPILALSSNPPPPGLPDDPVAAPIDSTIFILITAGIVYGSYIIFKRK